MTLYIDACVREESRTMKLANCLLSKIAGESEGKMPETERAETVRLETVRLSDVSFPRVDEAFLKKRDQLIEAGAFDDPFFALARQFAAADRIVIAAPYWDLSFPAALKQYFEQINVVGITFMYTPEGIPKGLCRAKKLYYVMTAGGVYVPEEFGFGYVKALAQNFYGIADVRLIKAVGLDIDGADAEGIMRESMEAVLA